MYQTDEDLDQLQTREQALYGRIEHAVAQISWQNFEQLCFEVLREIGFLDLHRMHTGSQQGRDLFMRWPSRLVLGEEVRIRVQCKHVSNGGSLQHTAMNSDFAQFAAQQADGVLLLMSNAPMSNDLLELVDKLMPKGVHAFTHERLFRLFATAPQIMRHSFGDDLADELVALRHLFEIRDVFESICLGQARASALTIRRYWTEPYSWLFLPGEQGGEPHRLWTAAGGDVIVSWFNDTKEIQLVGTLALHVLQREDLPPFAVVCTTPKGGMNLPPTPIAMQAAGNRFPLTESNTLLQAGESISLRLDFLRSSPGIYVFEIVAEGVGGPSVVRRCKPFRMAVLPTSKELPDAYVDLHSSWPACQPAVEQLLHLGAAGVREAFGASNLRAGVQINRTGGTVIRAWSRSESNSASVDLSIDLPAKIRHELDQKTMPDHAVMDFMNEFIDPSEPRGPAGRADSLAQISGGTGKFLDALAKAHERAPFHPKLNASYGMAAYGQGQLGTAWFYVDLAWKIDPRNPIIAGIRYWLSHRRGQPSTVTEYLSSLEGAAVQVFNTLVLHSDNNWPLPSSYWQVASLAASMIDRSDLIDRWSLPVW